jgi:uncharacterized membrane protein
MGIFSFFKKDPAAFFSKQEKDAIFQAIQNAEQRTSGEVRVFIENRCRFVNPLDRAAELFFLLKMDKTVDRNAVMVYLAMKDRQFAVFADEGIYKALGKEYWSREAEAMLHAFKAENYAAGLVTVINDVGEALHQHFPYDKKVDKNELPDDIVFGK